MTRSIALLIAWIVAAPPIKAQEADGLIVRPPPPSREDFEGDEDGDGVPDAWYNLRDASIVPEGGTDGPALLRFEGDRPSRPARASRGFGVDGRETEALIVGLWVRRRGGPILPGERVGEEPSMLIDLLDDDLRTTARGVLGPWDDLPPERWVLWSKRIPVPPSTRDAIMTVGLLGATGTLEIDGLTIEEVPVGGTSTTDLVLNGGFELGGLTPDHWLTEGEARRVHPGVRSETALELSAAGDRALIGLGLPMDGVGRLEVSLEAESSGQRGAGGAQAVVYFLDHDGRELTGRASVGRVARWAGSSPWRTVRTILGVPLGATGAVLQFEKLDRQGVLRIDDVSVQASGGSKAGPRSWTPYHVAAVGETWPAFEAAEAIEAGTALDASWLLEAPAGSHGFVDVDGGHLTFEDGTPARFFGVALLPPLAVSTPDRADALADRLARSGVNLALLADIDAPLGPGGSLIDDARDETSSLDPLALADFDHLVAALKARGIALALTLQGQARFRADDEVPGGRSLPPGGGPASAFDPSIRDRAARVAEALLTHRNPETGLPLADDPALAWVTLAGEHSLFDLLDDPDALPDSQAEALRDLARDGRHGSGRALWRRVEGEQWSNLADRLRGFGVHSLIAGSSHWRREPDFSAAQRTDGLDLIEDRLFWEIPRFASPERRSLLSRPSSDLVALADAKRDRRLPYVVGQYASYTDGAWALPMEGPDLLFAAATARAEGWDALVRRGVARLPKVWGAAASGTGGGQDLFVTPEIINGNPQVFALLPHAAALTLVESDVTPDVDPSRDWDRRRGVLRIVSPRTVGLAGSMAGVPVSAEGLTIRSEGLRGAVVATAVGGATIAQADRLLVTAVGRAVPSGLEYVDHWRREVADPGRPPIRVEPIRSEITWRHERPVRAYPLDSAGRRLAEIPGGSSDEGTRFVLDGREGRLHWELVAEPPERPIQH